MTRNTLSVLLCGALFASPLFAAETETRRDFDVVIYGATPGGIAAAIPLARRNTKLRIALVTPFQRVGGMMTNGLTHPDFRTFEARTGLYREFNKRVEKHYRDKYGADSQQVKDSLHGTHAGPEINHTVLRQMLDLHGIEILTQHRLASVQHQGDRIESITLSYRRHPALPAAAHSSAEEGRRDAADTSVTLSGKYFVDATYEGDLMAAAGVAFRVGREAQGEYGESLAPQEADKRVQGYNFRLTMTDVPENRAAVPKPDGYQRKDYLGLLPLFENGSLPYIFGDPFSGKRGGIYKRQTPKLPNGKRDINDVSHSIVRLSLPNINDKWPECDDATRQRIFTEHLRHNVGMLYFLQHDEAVPAKFQEEARKWGLCRGEFTFNQHLPEQLYVREARRMVGRYVFTQRDVERAPGTGHARAVLQPNAIAMGDYGPNCHGTFHEGPLFGGRHTGEFYQPAAPYQIRFGVLLPKEFANLAVPVACSASHVGFCALRLEPIWMSLGQAAGETIGLALESNAGLNDVTPAAIRERLHSTGVATIYTSDVPEESADFAAVQWWGSEGGFVSLDRNSGDEPASYGERGKHRVGQYYLAFPDHEVGLDKPLTDRVRSNWLELARKVSKKASGLEQATTRGDFVRLAVLQRNLSAALDIGNARLDLQSVGKGLQPGSAYLNGFRENDQGFGSHRSLGDRHVSILDDHDHVFGSKLRFSMEIPDDSPVKDFQVVAATAFQLFTLGIPCIYYGSEQAFAGPAHSQIPFLLNEGWNNGRRAGDRFLREAMFGPEHPRAIHTSDLPTQVNNLDPALPGFGTFGTAGQHCFDPNSPSYVRLAALCQTRADHPVLRVGRQYPRPMRLPGSDFVFHGAGELVAWSRILDNQDCSWLHCNWRTGPTAASLEHVPPCGP